MDKKLKLNARMNVYIFKTNFWLGVTNTSVKIAKFATERALKYVRKNVDIANEMLKEDYPESFKIQLETLVKRGNEL